MESNWQLNVVDLGWSLGPYRRIARVLGAPFGLWIAQKIVYDGTYDGLAITTPEDIPRPVSNAPIPPASPHFPYGAPVLGD